MFDIKYLQNSLRNGLWAMAVGAALGLVGGGARAWAGTDPKPSKEMQEEARKLFGKDRKDKPSDSEASAASRQWCIVLLTLRDDDRDKAAPLALDQIRGKGRVPEAYVDRRAAATLIACGKFDAPDSPEAERELQRIRSIEVDGLRPYAYAVLCPPEIKTPIGSMPEYNLLQAKVQFGEHALQTLQVAVYGRDDLKNPTEKDLKECRDKAEEYCAQLRREGEVAYYYHGPRRSMVTIGVFDQSDYDAQVPGYNSARLADTKKRHPYNLYNGAAIREKRPGDKDGRLQPSMLVKIPDPPPGADSKKPGEGDTSQDRKPVKLAPPR